MTRSMLLASALMAALALGGCKKELEAPLDTGVCWHLANQDGRLVFNKLSVHEPRLESCAASLEAMRLHFLAIGGSAETITGAYQGNFLFLQKEGVFTSEHLNGARFLLLVRTEDGQLAKLGAGPVGP